MYTIQIERSLGRAAEVKLSVFENIDGIIVDDFYNTAIGEGEDDPEALTAKELRQLLEDTFGGEWIQTDDVALANAVGVDQFIRLTPQTLQTIASSK